MLPAWAEAAYRRRLELQERERRAPARAMTELEERVRREAAAFLTHGSPQEQADRFCAARPEGC